MIWLLICLCFSANILYTAMQLELDEQNIDLYSRKEKFTFTLFYSPWQETCLKLVGILADINVYFAERKDVLIGKLDIYKHRLLASRFSIDDYCQFKYSIKGSEVLETYNGKRSVDDIIDFIRKYSEKRMLSNNVYARGLISLTAQNFDRVVKNSEKTVLVYFYTSWCLKCRNLTETVNEVARVFKDEKDCVISTLNGDSESMKTIDESVGVYPTFKLYQRHNKDGVTYHPGKLDENWSTRNITKFMNANCGLEGETVEDKWLGKLEELDSLVQRFVLHPHRREKTLLETIRYAQDLPTHKQKKCDVYVNLMKRIVHQGMALVAEEIRRIERVLLNDVARDKQEELSKKRNVLKHIRQYPRDEL